ncbi:HK-domain-containing protein [Thelephora ganbajun]|uniref:HK-domain-containing protein n=1 Tax=Thelephora ganbajun TaxID=370292 RepID=A0ACB6ZDT2_THEGA|nr:HK-domain-containing protein [Thelephora ganbajun]
MEIDYSLYLVTGRNLIPDGITYEDSLEQALKGGVTVVQVREKTADTGEFLEVARATKKLCEKYKVPLIINDRIDIALAVEADGVHLGQTDMPIKVARKLLPANAIIGISCNTGEEVEKAVSAGADYVGIGPVCATSTKQVTSPLLGPRNLGDILVALENTNVKSVAIGGIKSTNATRILFGSIMTSGKSLDGLAVVSDIVASPEPLIAAKRLKDAVSYFKASRTKFSSLDSYTTESLKGSVGEALRYVREVSPLVHQITNVVVTTQSANATIALGASPIMATSPEEMEDLARIPGGLLINFGTLTSLEGMIVAGQHANQNKKPVVFDPVGVGATSFRKRTAAELLNAWQATVIKGNAGEIGALSNSSEVQSKGVDSTGSGFTDPASTVRSLALRERCVVGMTGAVDWVSDGKHVVRLGNGHPLLGEITGSGCMVGTSVATFCGALSVAAGAELKEVPSNPLVDGDMFVAAIAGISAVTIASEIAALRPDVQGPGTFLPAFIDELSKLTPEVLSEKVNIEIVS